jgi:hypothetical protein
MLAHYAGRVTHQEGDLYRQVGLCLLADLISVSELEEVSAAGFLAFEFALFG